MARWVSASYQMLLIVRLGPRFLDGVSGWPEICATQDGQRAMTNTSCVVQAWIGPLTEYIDIWAPPPTTPRAAASILSPMLSDAGVVCCCARRT